MLKNKESTYDLNFIWHCLSDNTEWRIIQIHILTL